MTRSISGARGGLGHVAGVSLLAAIAYLYALDGLHIPHIGDEAPYVEIARLTAESGDWLPLRTAPGLESTKPPALFWIGIAATDWGEQWSLFRLRLPIVAVTFLTALVVFWTARRLELDRVAAALAGLTYLAFYSTFQYGRPFLTNAPETLFVFLAFALVLLRRDLGSWTWPAAGLSLGLACLFKSFALVVPAGAAMGWLLWMESGSRLRAFVFRDGPRLAVVVALALGVFALWPALDPDPASIFRHFVLEENFGKLSGRGYLGGLVSGPYALHRIWLGHLANAGLLAVPLVYVAVEDFRDRLRLEPGRKALWILVLAFLVVYSLPSQRQGSYLLPSVPALAVLMAWRWRDIPDGWFRVFAVPGAAVSAVVLWVMLGVQEQALPPGGYRAWHFAVPGLALVLWMGLAAGPRLLRSAFHAFVFVTLLSLAAAVAPFEGPLGRFQPERVNALAGRRIYVPSEFVSKHERHRLLLPGARIVGYDAADAEERARRLEAGHFVVLHRPLRAGLDGPFRVFATRLDLRSRQTLEEMMRIVFRREVELLVRHELVVRLHRRERRIGENVP